MVESRPIQPGIFARHGWLLPVGCGVALLLGLGGCVGIVGAVFYSMRSSGAYQMALKQVKADPLVRAKLGAPLTDGFIVGGNIQLTNDAGTAALNFKVTGTQGSAQVSLRATKAAGVWTLDELRVDPEDGSGTLWLVGGPPPTTGPGLGAPVEAPETKPSGGTR
ncbi:MAG: hypothetical protein AMXMBFR7_29510 [Planctomycetota bacterium]